MDAMQRCRDPITRLWKAAADLGAEGLATVPTCEHVEGRIVVEHEGRVGLLRLLAANAPTCEPSSDGRLARISANPNYRNCASTDVR